MAEEQFVRRRVATAGLSGALDAPQRAALPAQYLSAAQIAKNRTAPRAADLLAAIARLDTEPNALASQQIMEWVKAQYDERGGGELVGLFSRCYLGHPYVDHVMTLAGTICEHFTPADAVPPTYRGARSLAANPAYEYVEVYADGAVVPVRPDGRALF